jgi:hypothetical protein
LTIVDEMGDFLWFDVRWQDNHTLGIANLTIFHQPTGHFPRNAAKSATIDTDCH